MHRVKKLMDKERLARISHSHSFHTTHGIAHVFYFIAVMAEGHGLYAIIGGAMVVFSLITVVAGTDED
ncbi:hypothetical protein [Tardiphaga sp. 367_B4_N1_1]|uniref:hypothetical protein n=1 Tax=Tardiphaga sp. 367_B4_N1_1 TaxID=3240777 RepID=UPI003F29D6B7